MIFLSRNNSSALKLNKISLILSKIFILLTSMSEGELTLIEATRVMGLIDSFRRTLELTEIEQRLQALEAN